jgi:Adenylate and Guanylate cyclase catalytic domain
MMAAIHRYEGTVNQVMGDRIMALFGAPIAHEDRAVRACYTALAMQASVKEYVAEVQRTQGVPIHIRIGLNSSEVVVRVIGSDLHMDGTAVGQTTHRAARMETVYDTLSCVDAPRRPEVTRLKPTSGIPLGDNSAPRGDQDHRCMNGHVNPGLAVDGAPALADDPWR